MWDYFFGAIALLLVFEGILPFVCPPCWRQWMKKISRQEDSSLRIMGLSMMIVGVLLLYLVNFYYGDI